VELRRRQVRREPLRLVCNIANTAYVSLELGATSKLAQVDQHIGIILCAVNYFSRYLVRYLPAALLRHHPWDVVLEGHAVCLVIFGDDLKRLGPSARIVKS
jgi:hypothetical protein